MSRCIAGTFAGPRPGGSLGPTWLPLPCPRTESRPVAIRDAERRRTTRPAEPNVTVAPAPSAAARSLRSRVLGRTRDHAAPERAVLVLHDVTKRTRTARSPCATSTWSSPRATSCSSSGPSGAGKSTLIKLLIRDEVATAGAVVLDGQDLARLPPPPGAEDAPQDRDHLPGLQAAAVEDGLGERRLRARGDRHAAPADPSRRSTASSPSSA